VRIAPASDAGRAPTNGLITRLVTTARRACGVPVVASPVARPHEAIEQDVTGCLHADLAVALGSALRLERHVGTRADPGGGARRWPSAAVRL
jgi:hypothetical protein